LELGETEVDWKNWKLDVKVSGVDSVKVVGTVGAARVQLQVGGTVAAPDFEGEVRLALRGAVGGVPLELEPLLLKFPLGKEPELEIQAKGVFDAAAFSTKATGPLSQPKYQYAAEAPLTVEKLRGVFEQGMAW
jgi:hypothetical protein